MNVLVLLVVICVIVQVVNAATRQITINAHYPKSLPSLYLRGDNSLCSGLNWNKGIKMELVSSDTVTLPNSPISMFHNSTETTTATDYTYSVTLSCDTTVNNLELKVLIGDSTWMIGSNHHLAVTSSTKEDHIYPWFFAYSGSLTTISRVYSPELNNFRDIIVYLPPSYNENTLKVHKNVLIMHDGQNLFDPKTSAFGTAWMCQDTINQLVVEGKMDEILIIGAYNTNDRTNEYTYIYDPSEKAGGKGDLYLNWIESTLIPLTAKTFRVDMVRERLGILGSSLGGLISCYAGYTRSTVYGKVGCMSSSFWWDDNDFQNHVIVNNRPSSDVPYPVFYMDSGTSGGDGSCAVYTSQVYDYYVSIGFQENTDVFKYIDAGGSHNEASWGARFYLPMQDLYPASTV